MTHAQRLSTGRGPVATNVEHEMDMTEQYHPSINRIFFLLHTLEKKRESLHWPRIERHDVDIMSRERTPRRVDLMLWQQGLKYRRSIRGIVWHTEYWLWKFLILLPLGEYPQLRPLHQYFCRHLISNQGASPRFVLTSFLLGDMSEKWS